MRHNRFSTHFNKYPVGYRGLQETDARQRVMHLMTCKSVLDQKRTDGRRVQTVHTSDRQTQPHGDKQSLTPGSRRPVGRHWCACSGIEGKCQAKHTSMEARRHCQGVLMQPAWCFSNEDMLYTAEKTRGTQTRGGKAQTITQRISPTEGIKQKREAEPNGEDDSRQKNSRRQSAEAVKTLERIRYLCDYFLRIF